MNQLTHDDLQEQKKMRKQRRQAELQDKRDRIRMGLIPPDPPKGVVSTFVLVVLLLTTPRSAIGQPDEGSHFRCRPRSDPC